MPNPYLELYRMMGDATPVESPFLLGKVKNTLPDIKIETETIELDKDSLLIDSGMKILDSTDISCSNGSITHNLKDVINVGDTVLLTRVGAKFIIISKVVSI